MFYKVEQITIFKFSIAGFNKCYIGYSKNYEQRKGYILYHLKKGSFQNREIQDDYNDSENQQVLFEVLEIMDDDEFLYDVLENYKKQVKARHSYNSKTVGRRVTRYCAKTQKSVHYASISKAAKDNKLSIPSISKALKSKKICGGYYWSDFRENNKDFIIKRTILRLTKTGEYVDEWRTFEEITKTLGYAKSNVHDVCTGKRKSAYGYKWEYKS